MPAKLRVEYQRAFDEIYENILRMSDMVDSAIARALKCLQDRDLQLAQQIIDEDDAVNDLRFEIEEDCLKLIATQQPAASDLRAIVAAMNIVVDVERMGDYAAGIAKTVLRMGDEPLLKPLIDIPRMVEISRNMLRGSIKAFVNRDPGMAKEIAARDDEMDRLYKAIFDELVEIMSDQPESAPRATFLLWIGHNLERIGDRVTNIAERVVFVNTGNMKELND
ncbi:MAG: phosphate signaling complex protein PhoU [Anaerolineales bacterium]